MGRIAKLRHIAAAVLSIAFAAFAQNGLSVRLPLPEQLNRDILPHFSAKDRNSENVFQRRHLERMITPDIKRVALVYFATWCMPCAKGAAELRKAKDELKRRGVLAVFVNVGEKDTESVRKWLKEYGDPEFPLIMDARLQLAGPLGLLEPDGKIVMPKTLVLNSRLKPLFLLGAEGDDFPEILWRYNP
jgi:peroxiredoxin